MEDTECMFCNRSSTNRVIEENGYTMVKCPTCGLIYLSPRPSSREIRDLYIKGRAYIPPSQHISSGFLNRLYAKHHLQLIKKYKKGGSLLEIGAGGGYFLDETQKNGYNAYGIELNNIQADFVRNSFNIPCEELPLNDTSFGGKKFDVIYHCDVISHLYDTIGDFQTINDRLKNDGIVVFETSNIEGVDDKYFKLFSTFQLPDHLSFFGETNLKELLDRTGFELIKIYKYSVFPQLLILKTRKSVFHFFSRIFRTGITGDTPPADSSDHAGRSPVFSKLVRPVLLYLMYIIRYRIGYIFPKNGLPQTVIVIARKNQHLDN